MKPVTSQTPDAGNRTEPNTGGWQIVYTGFVLIMLCFFIMMTSYASLEKSRITRFVRSFSNAVSILPGGESLESGETMIDGSAAIVDKEDEMARLFETVRRLSSENGIDRVELAYSRRGVVMTLADKLLFDSGNAELTAGALALMARIAHVVKQVNAPVRIVGHTDSRPIHSDLYPSNWELSTARAVAVLRYLKEKADIDVKRLSAVGVAEFQPLQTNDTPAHMAANRRVEIIFELNR